MDMGGLCQVVGADLRPWRDGRIGIASRPRSPLCCAGRQCVYRESCKHNADRRKQDWRIRRGVGIESTSAGRWRGGGSGIGAGGGDGVANVRTRNVGGRGLARGGGRLFFTTPLANPPRAGGPLEGTDGGGGLRGGRAFFCGVEFANHGSLRFSRPGLGRFMRDELYGDRRLGSRSRCGHGAAFDGAALGGDGTRAADDGFGLGGIGIGRGGVGRAVVAFGAGLGGERVGVAGIGAAPGIVFGRSAARVGGRGFADAVVGFFVEGI